VTAAPAAAPRGEGIPVGISSCLLGHEVRWNGGHKQDRYITDTLGRWFTFVPVCPEEEMGLGVPRETLHLEGDPETPRLVFRKTRGDITDRMLAWSAERVERIASLGLCGYILKSDSPSCGMERVKVHGAAMGAGKRGVGLFARTLLDRLPLLPVEEEGRLHDPRLRENFIERVFAYRRLQELLSQRLTAGRLVDFHTRHKLLILSHSTEYYREMGRLVADARTLPARDLAERYATLFMAALRLKATPRRHANVLQHILGYMKKGLDRADKEELLAAIDEFRRERIPLVVPLALLRHHLRRLKIKYVLDQVYLSPHPTELMLRNHV
jgi:uncharacterized protein YbgA (DUF1722 family)/uncharacterized protein YbbK (DUF523 family)